MKNHLTIIFAIFFSLTTYAQIKFEKGYFISNANQKTECFIKNMAWINNPTNIKYKLSEGGATQNQSIESIKEFGIYNESKYVRVTLNIDRSSEKTGHLSGKKEPEFVEEKLFLNVLVEGQASLFLYKESHLTRFFFKKNDSEINQLIYKEYLVDGSKIAKNYNYRVQLYDELKCESFTLDNFKNINYSRIDLEKIFKNYNLCKNSDFITFENKKNTLNLNIRLHTNSGSLRTEGSSIDFRDSNFGNQIYFGLGAELEQTLNFNRNKWSIFIEPTFELFQFENEKTINNTIQGGKLITKIDYKFIKIPLGIRHHMFINDKSKLFINAAYILNFSLNSNIVFERANGSDFSSQDIVKSRNYGFGLGYKYDNKYSLELRYLTTRGLLEANSAWRSDLTAISLILGYKIF